MRPLTTTFALLRESPADEDAIGALARSLGGERDYGADIPIPLLTASPGAAP